jgi:predicted transcriptional regulator
VKPETEAWQVMSRPVRKLSMNAKLRDAAEFLRRWGISGAPVTDSHGRPVGVLSLRDIAGRLCDGMVDLPMVDPAEERDRRTGEPVPVERGFHIEGIDDVRVSELMTPGILCVDPEAPIEDAIRMMQQHAIHRVFVRRGQGALQGVITTMDILRLMAGQPGKSKSGKRVG